MEDGWSRRCRSNAAVRSVRSVTTSWRSSFRKTVAVSWRPRRPKLCVRRSIGSLKPKTFLKSSVSSRLYAGSVKHFDAHCGAQTAKRCARTEEALATWGFNYRRWKYRRLPSVPLLRAVVHAGPVDRPRKAQVGLARQMSCVPVGTASRADRWESGALLASQLPPTLEACQSPQPWIARDLPSRSTGLAWLTFTIRQP